MELADSLKEFIEEGSDWERKNTSVKGVSIIRLPAYKTRPASLAIDINPVGENGLPMKKKGIMVMSAAELQAFREIFKNEKLDNLVKTLEDVTGKKPAGKAAKPDVVQI
jgi:uroporphyrinogen-III synthase